MPNVVFSYGPGWAERRGGTLIGELSYRRDGKRPAPRIWQPAEFDAALTQWFGSASEGGRVEVIADVDGEGRVVQIRMAHPPAFVSPPPDRWRLDEVTLRGGAPNPYTFIPTPPRAGLPDGLGDGQPRPHGIIDADTEWSGWLVLRLVAQTPLLLPDPDPKVVHRDQDDHPTYPVRIGPDGMPLLHGASVKGALRSAYEAITNSRYGVFRGHGRPLAYRRPASKTDKIQVTPARVESDGAGGLQFRLCKALSVPLYGPPGHRKARAVGAAKDSVKESAGKADWRTLDGAEVAYTTREAGRPPRTRVVVDTIDLVAGQNGATAAGSRERRGWLSITGRSIETKTSERLFVPASQQTIPVTERHHVLWQAVLASYRDAAEYNEPGRDRAGNELERSSHVATSHETLDPLADGTLVYLDFDQRTQEVTAVNPVMIGRLPYQNPPSSLLDPSLHPAANPGELSPADRLFGWAPSEVDGGRPSASGYRGRLRVASVNCRTADWLVDHSPEGVTLAPLNSPKPTQFRFYTASSPSGEPVARGVAKKDGYQEGGGLRGRKAYWYPNTNPDGYWTPGTGKPDGRFREWQEPPNAKKSQTSTHLGWVREGTEFTIRLFLDAVPSAELGPLIWLSTQPGCPLRLGAGKPLGFGAVTIAIDWDTTGLRTGDALRGCWLNLRRPEASPRDQVENLAAEFEQQAISNPALAPSLAAFQKVTEGLPDPAAYPRTQPEPEAETYRWFVANERIKDRETEYGFALPHILEDDQNLPFLPPPR